MIRLIAADMDGTLLDSHKRLSPDLFPLIEQLYAQGIRFAIASGRQYQNLYDQFQPIADKLLFIAENGAMVYDGERCLFADEMPAEQFIQPIQTIRSLANVNVVLCTQNGAWIEQAEDPTFLHHAQMYYQKLTVVSDLLEVLAKQSAFKLAVFEEGHAENGCLPILRRYADCFAVVLSGVDWVDLMNPETNKGRGLCRLTEALAISCDETMAFGDYLNDYELLRQAGCSYVMENGHPDLKRIATHIAPSNDENGVVRAIRAHLKI